MVNIVEVSYKWNGGFSTRPRTDYIALHHAEATTCSPADIHSWHLSNGWVGIGYHFVVRKDGTIYRGRPLHVLGAHVSGMNNCSIGICAEGSYNGKDGAMPQAQFNAIVELCQYLKQNYYPNAKIVGHREIGDSNCPGKDYPLQEIKDAVENGTIMSINPYDAYKDALFERGYITNEKVWSDYDAPLRKSQAVALADNITGGTWFSEEADPNIHWCQPSVISLCGKGYISDKEQWLSFPDAPISKALLLALVDNATNGMDEKYVGRLVAHWGQNCLDSLCDKAIVETPEAWLDFEGQVGRGQAMALFCKAFNI